MLKTILYISLLIIISCSSSNKVWTVPTLSWEKDAVCTGKLDSTTSTKTSSKLYRCAVKVNGEYKFGLVTDDKTVLLKPVYDEIFFNNTLSYVSIIYVKNKGDRTYKVYNRVEKKLINTPITFFRKGKRYEGKPRNASLNEMPYYSAALSDGGAKYHILTSDGPFKYEINNVDTDKNREKEFPAIFRFFDNYKPWLSYGDTVLVRHNVKGKLFYQVYNLKAEKIGSPIDYNKITYLQITSRTYKGKPSPVFNVTPWVHIKDDIYMPLLFGKNNRFFDPTANYGDLLGMLISDHPEGNYVSYSGAQPVVKKDLKEIGGLVFKDDKGLYYSKDSYNLQSNQGTIYKNVFTDPVQVAKDIKLQPGNFYRNKYELPFKTPKVVMLTVYENYQGYFSIKPEEYRKYGMTSVNQSNLFESLNEVKRGLERKYKMNMNKK